MSENPAPPVLQAAVEKPVVRGTPGPISPSAKSAAPSIGKKRPMVEEIMISDSEEDLDGGDFDEDEEEEEYAEPILACCVDTCRSGALVHRCEFLPKDNVAAGVEMIIACKAASPIGIQNKLLQQFLEADYLASLPGKRTIAEWNRCIPFRLCPAHSNDIGAPVNLPPRFVPTWSDYSALVLRRNLFRMYGVQRAVDMPKMAGSEAEAAAAMLFARRTYWCHIPGCGSHLTTVDKSLGSYVALYPFPLDESLRRDWLTSITTLLGRPIALFPNTLICERHFANGGKVQAGKVELPTVFEARIQSVVMRGDAAVANVAFTVPAVPKHAVEQNMKVAPAVQNCMVRTCRVTSTSVKGNGRPYQLYKLPLNSLGDIWIKTLRTSDFHFTLKGKENDHYVCERHFAAGCNPSKSVPCLFLAPAAATMSRLEHTREPAYKDEPCDCCKDVEICQQILRRFNSKMNTLMQHVNTLCVLEGVKEVVPRKFDDQEDDAEVHGGDPEKVAMLAGVRAASMFAQKARGELSALSKAINEMEARRACAVFTCNKYTSNYRLISPKEFEDEMKSGNLLLQKQQDINGLRKIFMRNPKGQVAICDRHFADHIDNVSLDTEEDNEAVKKLKQVLAIPKDFQPSFKRRRVNEAGEYEAAGGSGTVKVEVKDDVEEDERLLSNNELLQQLLGGAIAGKVTGEIGDNGEVYGQGKEEEEEEEEMDELDNQEPEAAADVKQEEEDEEEDNDDDEDQPPELA